MIGGQFWLCLICTVNSLLMVHYFNAVDVMRPVLGRNSGAGGLVIFPPLVFELEITRIRI